VIFLTKYLKKYQKQNIAALALGLKPQYLLLFYVNYSKNAVKSIKLDEKQIFQSQLGFDEVIADDYLLLSV
jgi:hypothetical protein